VVRGYAPLPDRGDVGAASLIMDRALDLFP
jgi:hypothetical protein